MSIVTDFKSIRQKLDRQEQKAEFEEKNPPIDTSMYGWPYGAAVPLVVVGDWLPKPEYEWSEDVLQTKI